MIIMAIFTDKKINNKIKHNTREFFSTFDLNTEIIFNECINRNDNCALEESKYLFFSVSIIWFYRITIFN